METSSKQRRNGATGWDVFAGTVLLVVASLDFIYGLSAVLNDQILTSAGSGSGVIIWDFTTWGWVHMAVAGVLLVLALSLFSGRSWARIGAVALCVVAAVLQVGMMTVFPLWSILLIVLYLVVAYNLLAAERG